MSPTNALIISIIFIISLLIWDSRGKYGVTSALWIPFLWMLIIGTMNVSAWLNPGSGHGTDLLETMEEGSIIDRVTFLLLELIGIFILIKRRINLREIFTSNTWVFIFLIYCFLSVTWSDFPFISLKRWVKSSGNFVMVLIILTEPDPDEAIKTIFKRFTFLVIPLSVIFIKYFGDLGREYSPWDGTQYFTGVGQGKNSLGNMSMMSGFFLIWNLLLIFPYRRNWRIKKEIIVHLVLLIMTFWLLIKAKSATSTLCLVIGIVLIILVRFPLIRGYIKYFGIFFTTFLLFFFILEYAFDISRVILSILGRDATLTGRTDLWKIVLGMVNNPFLGTGYESFWLGERLEELWRIYWWHPRQAHNGYLETYINLGAIGLVLLIILIVNSYKNCVETFYIDYNVGIFRLSFLFIVLFYNITEATFYGTSLLWFIFLLVTFTVLQPTLSSSSEEEYHNESDLQFLS